MAPCKFRHSQLVRVSPQAEIWNSSLILVLGTQLAAYVGPQTSELGKNGAEMIKNAMQERNITHPKVVCLAYPENYGKGNQIVASLTDHLNGTNIEIGEIHHLQWGAQAAYDAALRLLSRASAGEIELDVIYSMDDRILMGAYQARRDFRDYRGKEVTLIGSVSSWSHFVLPVVVKA